jgi:hypothetical protein
MDEVVSLHEKQKSTGSSIQDQWKKAVAAWRSLGKRRWIIVGTTVGIFIAPLAFFLLSGSTATPAGQLLPENETRDVDVAAPQKPTNKELPLDGAIVTQEEYDKVMKYLPMAVMVENLISVRPVSGLSRADLVFEAMVEGGITRYMAVFHHYDVSDETNANEVIMPVRSARSYFLDWVIPLDATYMHIGGASSPDPRIEALGRINSEGIRSYNNVYGSWWRRTDRLAPHNAYTTTARMKDNQNKLGWAGATTVKMWKFKEELAEDQRPEGEKTINLEWSGRGQNGYNVKWVYDRVGNRYFYEVAGARQVDPATGDDVTAKNIVMQYHPVTPTFDSKNHVIYATIGSGKALIFLDGRVVEATWEKPNVATRTVYKTSDGKEVEFNRGRTWIQAIPDDSNVTY